mmetsp:Transcript_28694/g.63192  ORF Transcript_28694/g.63192 Transcript_28694/m.63192 type:complete len:228 (+) Transcript_28694:44-727(+)
MKRAEVTLSLCRTLGIQCTRPNERTTPKMNYIKHTNTAVPKWDQSLHDIITQDYSSAQIYPSAQLHETPITMRRFIPTLTNKPCKPSSNSPQLPSRTPHCLPHGLAGTSGLDADLTTATARVHVNARFNLAAVIAQMARLPACALTLNPVLCVVLHSGPRRPSRVCCEQVARQLHLGSGLESGQTPVGAGAAAERIAQVAVAACGRGVVQHVLGQLHALLLRLSAAA